MAATATAVVAEEDTELRDLLVQTLENSGVLNRIKAELRAAVFLALEEQEKAEFQGLEGRENLARDLGIIEAEGTVGGPLLLEVIRCCQQRKKGPASGEGALDLSDGHSPPKSPEGKTGSGPSKIPRYKGQGRKKRSGEQSGEKKSSETSHSDTSVSSSEPKSKSSRHSLAHETKIGSFLSNKSSDVRDKAGASPEEEDLGGDSFFDDPIPKPENTYSWRSEPSKQGAGLAPLLDAPPLKSGLSSLAGAPSLNNSESKCPPSSELDDLTQDLTVSQLSDVADYLEDVA
ncbi:centrosomal protein 43 [Orycteropus afer afer]|uniref:Centrosomal protein 43 n=1 Tax=Orycteropus afer afer TaxID=1230840 RepID=A0A8B7AME3_ORYAF|nr:centrosomal protein 43 [Orycteropus afer afer]